MITIAQELIETYFDEDVGKLEAAIQGFDTTSIETGVQITYTFQDSSKIRIKDGDRKRYISQEKVSDMVQTVYILG